MGKGCIAVEESFRRWDREPAFWQAYDALGDEFAFVAALIDARAQADLSQQDVAARMNAS